MSTPGQFLIGITFEVLPGYFANICPMAELNSMSKDDTARGSNYDGFFIEFDLIS